MIMKNYISKFYLLLILFFSISFINVNGQKTLSQARVYVNPGHGGWGSNDRPMATINYAVKDTLGFFETNTDLWKGISLRDELIKAGVGFVKMSRTQNGVVVEGDAQTTPNDKYREGDVVSGITQIVSLSTICMDVETNNMDYFLSIHSNAATEGTSTNYPLLLYRGTDAAPGNGLTNAKQMALDAWKYIVNNGVTYYSHYTLPTQNNVRGDITFYGSSSTFNGYTGYLGVLKHGADGFLSEGCFHTYQPERHRLLNKDYCRQEGVRYSRAIRAWFGDTSSKTTGDIMGTVKDKYERLEHTLYKYAENSVDAHYPLNNMKVVLKNAGGTIVGEYTTDNEYNGIYVFSDLVPGNYTLVYDFPSTDYIPATKQVEVKANETTFVNQLVTDQATPPPYPFKDAYYPTPVQPGDIAAPSMFEFEKEYDLLDIEALRDLTIRRAILKNNKYYVLAVTATKTPKLLVINPTTGELIKEMSTVGVVSEGYNGKEMLFVLSDIAFTTDGVLIGTNSTVVGKESNAFQTASFYVYKWEATETTALEDVDPIQIAMLPTNTSESLAAAGNNNSNLMANSIAVKGNINDFYLYFDSHAGNDWLNYNLRLVSWRFIDGVLKATQWTDNNKTYRAPDFGPTHRLTYSPFGDVKTEEENAQLHRFVIDGTLTKPIEFRLSWTANSTVEVAKMDNDLPVASSGLNFLRYLDKVYMTTAVCEKVGDKYEYKAYLYDVTKGIDKAVKIGTTESVITEYPVIDYMATAGVVNGANISMYLLVGNNIVKYKTKPIVATPIARIFASQLKSGKTESGFNIEYVLNGVAESVNLILQDKDTDAKVKMIPLTGFNVGLNSVEIPLTEIPEEGEFTWSIQVKGSNIPKFVKISDDSAPYRFFGPRGVAIDNSPESPYFGRVYVTNTANGATDTRETSKGIYILDANGTDITSQGNAAHTGGIAWATAAGESPRKVAVAKDGRVFVSDYSLTNSGIYYMNPETFEMASIFTGATREATYGKLSVGSTYVGGRTGGISVWGEGANTVLYGVDRSVAEATTWWKNVNSYKIGDATTWTKAPTTAGRSSSYFGNDNTSIVAVENGYWGAQFRGEGSENAGNPMMFYYNATENKPMFNTFQGWGKVGASENGGMALNHREKLIALAFNKGVAIFNLEMNGNTPIVTEKFVSNFNSSTITYDDFEFDYAGNLYGISYGGKIMTVWAMPTDNNESTTPAQRSMLLTQLTSSIPTVKTLDVKVYPNLVRDYCIVESAVAIQTIDVYTNTGVLVDRINGNALNSVTINTGHYAKGVYLIRVNNEKTVKIVKN